ncbi:MAG: hypothetical protein P4L51_01305 [Puia sp.]|nr:hypothetical protein [Puia sp.]
MSQTQEQLIDLLDSYHPGKIVPEAGQLTSGDPEIAVEWEYLLLAVEGLQEAGVYEQVEAVKKDWQTRQTENAKPGGAVVRTLYRNVMRVAACLLLITVGAAVVKYNTTSSTGIYEKYYSTYDLNMSRDAGTADVMDIAYTTHNWEAVTKLFNVEKGKSNKSYFLAGMADMELKRYDDAIDKFRKIIAANAQGGSATFEDEAEFYLAMSWLAKDNVREAMPLLDKIRTDKSHPYHDVVVRMSSLDLRIVQYKSSK